MNCLHSFRTKNKFESHKKVGKNNDCGSAEMTSEDTIMSLFSKYQNSDKVPFIIYVNFECLIEKIDGCKPQQKYVNKLHQVLQ